MDPKRTQPLDPTETRRELREESQSAEPVDFLRRGE
jgi:hypothetical protein